MTRSAVDVLAAGGVVAAATESFFGLFADARNPEALDALFRLKPRSRGSALVIPSESVWDELVTERPPLATLLARRFWPGPLTIALPVVPDLDDRLVVDGTVGVRVPGVSPALDLCRTFGGALTATSANPHGQPPPTDASQVRATFAEACARGVLLVEPGSCGGGLPSTIVVVHGDDATIARPGAVSREDIEATVGHAL